MTRVTQAYMYTRFNSDIQTDIPVIRDTIPCRVVNRCTSSKKVTASNFRVITILLLPPPPKKGKNLLRSVLPVYNVHKGINNNTAIINTVFV